MPQLGESVTEGTVERWLKREGDYVRRDEAIVEVVTDKVNAELPSPFEGRLVRISAAEGVTVTVGAQIAEIELAGAGEERPAHGAGQAVSTAAASPEPSAAAEAPGAGRSRLSPAVRRLIDEHGVDPALITGSGLGGRITRDDVLSHLAARDAGPLAPPAPAPSPPVTPPPAPPPAADGTREELVRITAMRRSIADHMTRSLATSPHAWTLQEVDVTALARYREAEKEDFRERHGASLTYLPFVIQALCDAIREFPELNSTWTDEGILIKRYINLGIAVAVPEGLIVPVIRDADRLGLSDLAGALDDRARRARAKRLNPDDVAGGTFTLNNTGATGSVASQPIINQPQAAILTTEAVIRRPVVIGDGIAVRHMMNVCLSFDHRIIDGMTAGRFLASIRARLEGWTPASIRL
jgi:2-oxoisovalerate dehydrogenase E2 component (dihydrolipoyl transacylase)